MQISTADLDLIFPVRNIKSMEIMTELCDFMHLKLCRTRMDASAGLLLPACGQHFVLEQTRPSQDRVSQPRRLRSSSLHQLAVFNLNYSSGLKMLTSLINLLIVPDQGEKKENRMQTDVQDQK